MSERIPIGKRHILRVLVGMPGGVIPVADVLHVLVAPMAPSTDTDTDSDLFFISWDHARDWIERLSSLDLAIAERLEREQEMPEGLARAVWVYYLVGFGDYAGAQVDVEVPAGAGRDAERPGASVRADIVVYRDAERTVPWIVIEVKAADASGGFLQAQSYARNLGAEFFAVARVDPLRLEAYRTGLYGAPSERVDTLPGSPEEKANRRGGA